MQYFDEEEEKKPFDETTLKALEVNNPDLIARYRQKMAGSDESIQGARDVQDYGSIANLVGKTANDFSNSKRSDVVLHNRMQDLGQAPTVKAAEKTAWDDSAINSATSRNLDRAKEDRTKAESGFWTDERLKDRSQELKDAGMVRDKAARSNDPKSAESAAARNFLKQVAPSAGSMEGFDGLSEAQVQKISPQIFERYKLDETIAARKEESRQRGLDREAGKWARREEKSEERAWKEEQVEKANTEKKKTMLNEIEDRRTNINENLDLLDKMVEKNGTYELTGSHNQDLDRLVDQIATDMAKLQDPGSVARPSEVEMVKKNLIQSGFSNKNSTARDVIKNFKSEVESRADNAYKIRGIEKPAPVKSPNGGASDKPEWAK